MKFMTKLETIIMNRTGCNRETANLVANDILQEAEKDIYADIVVSIFEEIDKIIADLQLDRYLAKRGFEGIINSEKSIEQRLDELKNKYEVKSMKLIPLSERHPMARCWFCRTDKSVKYEAKMVNTNPQSENRYMHILVCNKCALIHINDIIWKDE